MMQSTEKTMDCVCPYGKNLPITTEICPKCGLDLTPLARLYQISEDYLQKGNSVHKEKPGLAVSYYNAAAHSSVQNDTTPWISAIETYMDSGNPSMAADLLNYATDIYPDEEIWESLKKKLEKQIFVTERQNRRRSLLRSGFVVSSTLTILLAVFLLFYMNRTGSRKSEKTLNDYAGLITGRLEKMPELKTVKISSDSMIRFSGNLTQENFQSLWKLLSASGLSISKCDLNGISIDHKPEGPLYFSYQVRSGESLSKIAYSVYHDPAQWRKLFEINKEQIRNKDFLKPGTVLQIPIENYAANE